MEYRARNTNDMLATLFPYAWSPGAEYLVEEDSRNGPVRRFKDPVTLTFLRPWECVNFDAVRDANPFFHLMEALWMLGGRRDVAFLHIYNKQMAQYSDDGVVFNAPYGYRLRHAFGFDQLEAVTSELRDNPLSRQAVALLWDPADLGKKTKDKACNTMIVFSTEAQGEHRRLHMTVFNRSNDAVLGTISGANMVHMPFFQAAVAEACGFNIGTYRQISNNLHCYLEHDKTKALLAMDFVADLDPYMTGDVSVWTGPLGFRYHRITGFLEACETGQELNADGGQDFLRAIAAKVHNAWLAHKAGRREDALSWLKGTNDWLTACRLWLLRRYMKAN